MDREEAERAYKQYKKDEAYHRVVSDKHWKLKLGISLMGLVVGIIWFIYSIQSLVH